MSGFHNVCSHRSNRLVADERVSCRGALFRRFYNWAYSDRGELVRVSDEEKFIGLDKRDHGLTPVDIDIWRGFIFVHLTPDPAETLRDYLGGVADRLDGCPFDEMKLSQVYTVEERANWKVVLDAQNEVYHCRTSIAGHLAMRSRKTTPGTAASRRLFCTTITVSGRSITVPSKI